MKDYVAECKYEPADAVTVRQSGHEVIVYGPNGDSVYLTPKEARLLAKAVKKAAKSAAYTEVAR
jgi:dihydrodipicolinate synthase/N-acetylneuraminate lyase